MNIGKLPYTVDSMARKAIRPLMPQAMRISVWKIAPIDDTSSLVGATMDELNLSLTPSALHALSFLFDSPNAVANAPSFLLPTEYSPYRESVVLPLMPHRILNMQLVACDIGLSSVACGVSNDEFMIRVNWLPPLGTSHLSSHFPV